EVAHFMRFLNLFKQLFGADGMGTGPAACVAAVPLGARIIVDEASADLQAISRPITARWARLADYRYAILLGALEMYLRLTQADRGFLLGWCFAEMFALRKLSRFLITKKRMSQPGPPNVAALPFNLPPWEGHAVKWDDLEVAFSGALAEIAAI